MSLAEDFLLVADFLLAATLDVFLAAVLNLAEQAVCFLAFTFLLAENFFTTAVGALAEVFVLITKLLSETKALRQYCL